MPLPLAIPVLGSILKSALLRKIGVYALTAVAGSTVVKRWWGKKKDDVELLSVSLLGLFLVISGLMFAAKLRGVLK